MKFSKTNIYNMQSVVQGYINLKVHYTLKLPINQLFCLSWSSSICVLVKKLGYQPSMVALVSIVSRLNSDPQVVSAKEVKL